MTLEEKIAEWYSVKTRLNAAKKEEMDLRVEIVEEINGPNAGVKVSKLDFDEFTITAKNSVTKKMDFDAFHELLNELFLSPEEAKAVVYKPSIDIKALNRLDQDSQIFNLIYEVPAAPTLTLKQKDLQND